MSACRRAVMAICDPEKDYARNLMEYLGGRKEIPFSVHVFTTSEALFRFAREQRIDILLVSQRALDDEVRTVPAGKRMILSEELVEMQDKQNRGGDEMQEDNTETRIFKYQPASSLIREVMDCYSAEQKALHPSIGKKQEGRILGGISPAACSEKVLFDLAFGCLLAESERVLYLNLDSLSGLEEAAQSLGIREPGSTVSDLVYCGRRRNGRLSDLLGGMVQTLEGMDYLLPAPFPEDLKDVGEEEWLDLFRQILEDTDYSLLLVDFGDTLEHLPSLLEACQEVCLLSGKDRMAGFRISHFLKMLERAGIRAEEPWLHTLYLPSSSPGGEEELKYTVTQGYYARFAAEVLRKTAEKEYGGTGNVGRKSEGDGGKAPGDADPAAGRRKKLFGGRGAGGGRPADPAGGCRSSPFPEGTGEKGASVLRGKAGCSSGTGGRPGNHGDHGQRVPQDFF